MRRRVCGQITIFASLIIVLVISVVCAALKSVSVSVAKTSVDMACNLSIESMFAGYSSDLLSEFDVLYFKKTDELESKLKGLIEENSKYRVGFSSNKLQAVEINEIIMATDNGGDSIRREVLDYMKYGILSEAVQGILDSEAQIAKTDKTKEIVDKIVKIEEEKSTIDVLVLRIVSLVEGLETNENGFTTDHEKPRATNENFAKELCVGTASKKSTAVTDERVYTALSARYLNVLELLEDMNLMAEFITEDGDEISELGGNNSYSSIFSRNYEAFESAIDSAITSMQKAITIAEEYQSSLQNISISAENVKREIDGERSVVGDELADGFLQAIDDSQNIEEGQALKLCDVGTVLEGLRYNIQVLRNTKNIFHNLEKQLNQNNAADIRQKIGNCVDAISQYDNTKLVFDYTGVRFDSEAAGLDAIYNIKKFVSDGLLNIAITDTSKISEKEIKYTNLASSQKTENNSSGSGVEVATDKAFYNEYLFSKFCSYTDSFDLEGNLINTEAMLDYMLEYILCGNDNDHDNLESTVIKLSLIREGANLAYIFTDTAKKNESYALALSLLGFTGVPAAVKAGQYLIMAVWAYGEAMMDVRKLCSGENVELEKNAANWQLSLENLLAMKFFDGNPKTESKKGFNYEEYMRILLFMENVSNKYFRTMDAMELKMIEIGHADFRMKNYVYAINAKANFRIKWDLNYYTRDMKYAY